MIKEISIRFFSNIMIIILNQKIFGAGL